MKKHGGCWKCGDDSDETLVSVLANSDETKGHDGNDRGSYSIAICKACRDSR